MIPCNLIHTYLCFGESWLLSYSNYKNMGLLSPEYDTSKSSETLFLKNSQYYISHVTIYSYVRGAVKKFPEMWCSTVMVGHMTTLT